MHRQKNKKMHSKKLIFLLCNCASGIIPRLGLNNQGSASNFSNVAPPSSILFSGFKNIVAKYR